MNTIESIKHIINKYEKIREKNKTVSNKEIKDLYDHLQSSIIDVTSKYPDINLHRASGSGNLTKKPILYFFDKSVTNRATKGLYVALTMISDPKDKNFGRYSLYFTQGTNKIKKSEPNNWESIIKENSKSIIEKIPEKKSKNFIKYPDTLNYSKASILLKHYNIDTDVIEKDFKNDLKEILEIYDSYLYENSKNLEVNDPTVLIELKIRRGQPEFRKKLLKKYNETCVVTGCKVIEILEAAHIVPYADEGSYSDSNGLLLRSDIHALYDLNLISIDGEGHLHISRKCLDTEYIAFLKNHPIIQIDSSELKKNLDLRFQSFDPEY